MPLTAISWNIRHGLGVDGRQDLERIRTVIAAHTPDIVMLNEVDRRMRRSGFVDQVGRLARALSMNYYFSPSIGIRPIGYGNAVFAKRPLSRTSFMRLSCLPEPRKALIVELLVKGYTLTCIAVHLSLVHSVREREYQRLASLIDGLSGPVLLAGDFNSRPDCPGIRSLSHRLRDAFAHDPKPTYPAENPRIRIDYLFSSSDCNIIDRNVLSVEGSDHLPLYTVIDCSKRDGSECTRQAQTTEEHASEGDAAKHVKAAPETTTAESPRDAAGGRGSACAWQEPSQGE